MSEYARHTLLSNAGRMSAIIGMAAVMVVGSAAPASANSSGGMMGAHSYATSMHVAPTVTQPLNVEVKRPQVLRLSRPATSVVVGDPSVADVAVHSTDTLLVLGRSYGTTNVIAMDAAGRVIIDADINVTEHQGSHSLRVHGADNTRRSYRCAPDCLPSPSLGDDQAFVGRFRRGAPGINNAVATGAIGGSFPTGPSNGSVSQDGAFPQTFDSPPPGFDESFEQPDS